MMQQTRSLIGKAVMGQFRLMSYNILADSLVDEQNKYTAWQSRSQRLFDEIRQLDSHIVCLQEMDEDESTLSNHLKHQYHKLYMKRSLDKKDGCAIFVNRNRFAIVDTWELPLYQPEIDYQYLDRPNVCLLALIEDQQMNKRILICVTHLLFNQRRGDIKLLQLILIMNAIRQIEQQYSCAVVLCGDMNLIPRSPLYQFISMGEYDFRYDDPRTWSGQKLAELHISPNQETENKLQFNVGTHNKRQPGIHLEPRLVQLMNGLDVVMDHNELKVVLHQNHTNNTFLKTPIRLRSVYAEMIYKNKTPDYYPPWSTYEPHITTMSTSTKGCVDYIWINSQLQIATILATPIMNNLTTTGLLNNVYPSDHLPLVCDLHY